MNEKEKLQQAIKNLEAQEQRVKELREYVQKNIIGTVRRDVGDYKGCKRIGFTYYVEMDSKNTELANCHVKRVHVFHNPKMKAWPFVNEMACKIEEENFTNTDGRHWDVERQPKIEVEEFDLMWAYVTQKVVISQADFFAKHAPDFKAYEETKLGELDIPCYSIPANLRFWVDHTVFYLGDGRYLKTPNSKKYVLDKIREERAHEFRCSHLYEACDQAYVERHAAEMDQLEQIINS